MSLSSSQIQSFLSEVSDAQIQQRLKKSSIYLVNEHQNILEFTMTKTLHLLNMKKKSKLQPEVYNDFHRSVIMFNSSVESILNTYFNLILDKQFLSLQSQQDLKDKTKEVKEIIDRAAHNLIKRMSRTPEEEKIQQKKRKNKKAKNCKMPIQSTNIMLKWLLQHFNNPYPENAEKSQMAKQSGLAVDQVNNWFINARERVIKKFIKNNRDYQKGIYQQQSFD